MHPRSQEIRGIEILVCKYFYGQFHLQVENERKEKFYLSESIVTEAKNQVLNGQVCCIV